MSNQQDYLDDQEKFLRGIEKEILEQVRPTLNLAVSMVEALPDDATEEQSAAALARLNDEIADAIGAALFTHQRRIAEGAQAIGGGTIPRMKSPMELMESATIQGESIASNFKKEESDA